MRYLKIYENFNDIEDFKQEIKDRFSFIIHDFDLEEIPHDLEEDEETPGIFYDYNDFTLTNSGVKGHIDILIWVGYNFIEKFKSMESSIMKFIGDLRKLGYNVNINDSIDRYILYLEERYETNTGHGAFDPFEIIIHYK